MNHFLDIHLTEPDGDLLYKLATPFAFHTSQVSTVVAAHWTSPEAIALAKLLWTEPVANFDGKYYQLKEARLNPKPEK